MYLIKFYIDNDLPSKYKLRWYNLKHIIEQCTFNDVKKDIVSLWLSYCKLKCNMSLPYLHTHEGGVGYDKNRQIRFRLKEHIEQLDDNIVFYSIYPRNKKWTYTEIIDLTDAFRQFANAYILTNCVQFSIEKINKLENKTIECITIMFISFMTLTCLIWLVIT